MVTAVPFACSASIVQDFTDLPSTWTTQAPHWLVSQPTCVPVRPSFSRRSSTSSVRPSTSTEWLLPFTCSVTWGIRLSQSGFLLARSVAIGRKRGQAPQPGMIAVTPQ